MRGERFRGGAGNGGHGFDTRGASTMKALMHVTLPPLGRYSPEMHFAPLVFLLEGMIEVNRYHLEQARRLGAPLPELYESGVYYKEDRYGEENWGDVYYCLACGWADCDRLVIWRVAELRDAGIAARPLIKWQHLPYDVAVACGYPPNEVPPEGLWLVHCLVQFSDGTIEDTSKNLGMGGSFTSSV